MKKIPLCVLFLSLFTRRPKSSVFLLLFSLSPLNYKIENKEEYFAFDITIAYIPYLCALCAHVRWRRLKEERQLIGKIDE